MQYKVKDFRNEDGNKYVGLFVTDSQGHVFGIDKQIPLVDGESNAYYIQKAIDASQSEIDEWQSEFSVVGLVFNPETKELQGA
jgi:hypothetical protein